MIKPSWSQYLHNTRDEEIKIISKLLNNKVFNKGLEMGCGDGYQSKLLSKFVRDLVSTDLNKDRIPKINHLNIIYKVVDAEQISEHFQKNEFDFIFSSNLLEHVPNIDKCLNGTKNVLKDDGICIHVIPNSNWRFFAVLLHFPNKLINFIEGFFINKRKNKSFGNNINVDRKSKSKIFNFLVPKPHGISSNFLFEFYHFSKHNWIKTFERNNFEILKIINGPVSSGYGLGLNIFRGILENIGITTEYIYVLKKKK